MNTLKVIKSVLSARALSKDDGSNRINYDRIPLIGNSNDLKSIIAFMLRATAMPIDGGYGGIDMCITCKKNGRDKYKDEETGQTIDFCEHCPNNMTNTYKEDL